MSTARTWMVLDNSSNLRSQFTCGHCGTLTATAQRMILIVGGYEQDPAEAVEIRICMNCWAPTYIGPHGQVPAPRVGKMVEHLPPEVESAYREARDAFAAGASTATALMCRKILMNVAVTAGAKPNLNFFEYVDYLTTNHYVPPGSDKWLTHIRKGGNDATHEISATKSEDAAELLRFTQSLLTYMFELPGQMQNKPSKPAKGK